MTGDTDAASAGEPSFGETWAYESLVGALPGVEVSPRLALAVQFCGFEAAVLALGLTYDLPAAMVAGTVGVVVSTVGSVAMLRHGRAVRALDIPESYRRLLFGSSVEVVLTVLAYVALVTHLFVFEPRYAATPVVEALLGPEPPVLGVYLMLLVLWDVCYRVGVGWWASVTALWRTLGHTFSPETARALRRLDAEVVAFALVQLLLVPVLWGRTVLVAVVVGHVAAVIVVSGASVALLSATRT